MLHTIYLNFLTKLLKKWNCREKLCGLYFITRVHPPSHGASLKGSFSEVEYPGVNVTQNDLHHVQHQSILVTLGNKNIKTGHNMKETVTDGNTFILCFVSHL